MRLPIAGMLVLSILSQACVAKGEEPLASLAAPKSDDWLNADRWKDEQIDGKAAVRLVSGTSYVRLKVTAAVPKDGNVMLRLEYYSSGKPFAAGIGAWGSPTLTGAARPKGFQTEELVFPAYMAQRFLKDGKINLILTGGGADGPAFTRIEMVVPEPTKAMERFRQWVRDGTADAWTASRGSPFTQVKSDDASGPLEPTEQDRACGAVPMVRPYLSFIYPDSLPGPGERTAQGRVFLTPGEYEPFQFAVRALKDLPKLSAELVGPAPKGLTVDLRWVECVPVRTGGSRSTKFKVQPNRLWPRDIFPTVEAKAGQTQAWWAIVKAEGDLEAKTYPLKIAVKDGDRTILEFELAANILPFRLPGKLDRAFFVTDSHPVEDEPALKDLAEHGFNGLGLFQEFQPIAGGNVDFAAWDAYFALLRKHGIDQAFFWYLGNPRSGNDVKASVGADKFLQIVQGIQQRVQDGRYPKLFCMSIDEAVRSGKAFQESKDLYKLFREQAPALKVLGCSLDRFADTVKYEGNADVLACNGSFENNAAWCREKKVLLNTYSYVCAGVTAAQTRLNYGFSAYRYGAAAVNGWALRWYNGHPYNDLDAGCTDWGIFLPNWTGAPISTPSWEGFREGVDDLRYLAVLDGLVKEGKTDGKLLEELCANGVGKTTEMRETVVGDSFFGAAMQNAQDLDLTRARVIQEILRARRK